MRRRDLGIATAILTLLAAAPAPVVAGEIEYHPTYDAAAQAARTSHQLVMLILVAPGAKDAQGREICKMLREEVLPSEPIAKLISKCFAPFLLDAEEVKAGRQQVPPVLKLAGEFKVPRAYFYDAEGKEVGMIEGYMEAPNYLARLKEMAGKLAAVPLSKEAREAERAVKRGLDAMERKDFKTALEAFTSALGAGLMGEEKEKAQRLITEIQASATEKFEEGKTLETEHKVGSAIRSYRQCAWQFPDTEQAAKATARLDEIAKDTELRKKLHAFRARKLLAQAEAAFARKSYAPAAAAVDQILKDFADTPQVEAAKKLRAELDATPDAAPAVDEDRVKAEAERMLGMADTYRRNKMAARALAEYRKVLAKFPRTRFAETAQERIDALKEESKER